MTLIKAEGPAPKTIGARPEWRGRPGTLTDEMIEEICRAVRNHQSFEVAASLAKIKRHNLYQWLSIAAAAEKKLAEGTPLSKLTEHQLKCLELADKLTFARDQATAIAVGSWLSAGIRPSITKKRVSRVVGLTDENEPIWATEETVTEGPPDWRAVQSWLGVQRRGYNPTTKIEVTGADGGPIEIDFAARLNDVAAAIEAAQAIPAESTEKNL